VLIIETSREVCTVIVTVDLGDDADQRVMGDVLEHARAGLDDFRDCDAFIAGAVHVSTDGTRLVQYSQWTDEPGYVLCRDDPRWDELESTGSFMGHVRSGRAWVDARVFTVVAAADPAS